MTVLFLLAVFFCIYTYAGFPLWLHWRARQAQRPEAAPAVAASAVSSDVTPDVSIVIAAHNEAKNLATKIASLDALQYPTSTIECIFVSDGSTDETVDILSSACDSRENWHLLHYTPAAGKPTALNTGVAKASGEILVFMDARQKVSETSIRLLVDQLQDDAVGAASGELVLADDAGNEAAKVSLYWKYEKWIRENESRLFSTTGATGALYAIRRADYQPLPVDTLLDDFDTPVSLLRKGKRTVLVSGAHVYDQAEAESSREFNRKVRTLSGNFQSFMRHKWLFNPSQNPVWWQFLSHKVFRLLVPYAMVLALVASVLGDTPFLHMMLIAQVAFYALGVLGFLGWRGKLTTVIKIFLQLNAAAVLGAWKAAFGQSAVRWKAS